MVKAFNKLPRYAIFEAAKHLGIPIQILRAWAVALVQLKRIFFIMGHVSDFVLSATGFPEGDPLSVVAMLIVAAAWIAGLTLQVPTATPFA